MLLHINIGFFTEGIRCAAAHSLLYKMCGMIMPIPSCMNDFVWD